MLLIVSCCLAGLPATGRAEPLRAVYGVQAAGMQVMRLEVVFDLSRPGHYAIESQTRFTGVAGWFASGASTSRVDGAWQDGRASPQRFVIDGLWRGEARRVVLDYPQGDPVLRQIIPAADPDREPVPPELRRNSIDSLSALAQLTRNLAATGRCEGRAAVFDGRRSAEFVARTAGRDILAPWRNAWHGEALRCGFIGRQTGGFRRDDDENTRQVQEGFAWMARPAPGAPFLPVRVQMPGRWLGMLTGYLLEVNGTPANAASSNSGNSSGRLAVGAEPAMSGNP
ncbi:DUF3108 domain-containing protein [Pseudoroseomonas oryzae]|uniref:DUF3108 domain-containing protein n=2 Tax=Teichococcus oryzae TaxID=1608942 RepID=A0A5B2TET3_9PROT|nr:DUF3108 domain-containing protein [Pseudoroseomonas oryzae]